MADMIERLSRFDGPPEQFLVNLLAVQCHLAAADGGAILRINPRVGAEILAVYPQPAPGSTAPVWLAQSAESAPQVVQGGRPVTKPLHGPDDLYGQPASRHVILLPLRGGSGVPGIATFVVAVKDPQVLAATQQRLELTTSLLSLYEMRLTLQQRQTDLSRLRLAMETTAAVGEHDRFHGAAMAFCNEIAARWSCERVTLGFLKGRYVHLKAMSHTEKFSRKMKVVQDLEAAMEETLDQDVEVTYPAPQEATFVNRAAGELSKQHGPTAVLSLPLRRGDDPVGVLTVERTTDHPFAVDEVEALRLTTDLSTAWLSNLHEHDRWVGARMAGTLRNGLSTLVGPKHTWIKMLAVGICAAILFLVFVKGAFRADATFVLDANTQRVVPAPYEGYLKRIYVEPGDMIVRTRSETPSWTLKDTDEYTDVEDWGALLATLHQQAQADAPSPGRDLWRQLPAETRRAVEAAGVGDANQGVALALGGIDKPLRQAVLDTLNDVLRAPPLHTGEAWKDLVTTDRQKDLVADAEAGRLREVRGVELNRSLLTAALPGLIAPGPTVLGTLDTTDLRLARTSAVAELHGYNKQADAAMKEDKRAEAQIAKASADKVRARIRLLDLRIEQAVIVSPIDGYVVAGELKRQLGAPKKTGDVLFEIADLVDLRASLAVSEDIMADLQAARQKARQAGRDLTGELATASQPDRHFRFTVQRINPIAEVDEQSNVFKVRVRLDERADWLRPGMEGVAKIDIDRRSYGYIWTRGLINWIRMKLWF